MSLLTEAFATTFPGVNAQYCADTVLAMEFIDGHQVTHAEVAALPQARRDTLGQAMLELFFYELYPLGVFCRPIPTSAIT